MSDAKAIPEIIYPAQEEPKNKRTGPKSKLTEDVIERIGQLIENAVSPADAAMMSGVAERTYYEWMEKGRCASSGPHRDLFLRVEKAKSLAAGLLVSVIRQTAVGNLGVDPTTGKTTGRSGDWKAAAWLLERLNPAVYAPTTHMNLNGKLRHDVNVQGEVGVKSMTDEELEERISSVRKRLADLAENTGLQPEVRESTPPKPEPPRPAKPVVKVESPPPQPPSSASEGVVTEPPSLATFDPQRDADRALHARISKVLSLQDAMRNMTASNEERAEYGRIAPQVKAELADPATRERYFRVCREVNALTDDNADEQFKAKLRAAGFKV